MGVNALAMLDKLFNQKMIDGVDEWSNIQDVIRFGFNAIKTELFQQSERNNRLQYALEGVKEELRHVKMIANQAMRENQTQADKLSTASDSILHLQFQLDQKLTLSRLYEELGRQNYTPIAHEEERPTTCLKNKDVKVDPSLAKRLDKVEVHLTKGIRNDGESDKLYQLESKANKEIICQLTEQLSAMKQEMRQIQVETMHPAIRSTIPKPTFDTPIPRSVSKPIQPTTNKLKPTSRHPENSIELKKQEIQHMFIDTTNPTVGTNLPLSPRRMASKERLAYAKKRHQQRISNLKHQMIESVHKQNGFQS